MDFNYYNELIILDHDIVSNISMYEKIKIQCNSSNNNNLVLSAQVHQKYKKSLFSE